jgi:hypothetical protein
MRPLLLSLALLALLLPSTTYAQNAEVERLLRRGVELRQQGSDAAALVEFEHAHELAHTPRTLAQVALCEQALGRWVDAETHLREALRSRANPWITRNRAALDGALGVIAQHIGQVMVRTDAPGAELSINGRRVATLPREEPVRVDAGEATIVVTAAGRSGSQRIVVEAGETVRITIRLGRDAVRTGVALPPPPPVRVGNEATPFEVQPPPPPDEATPQTPTSTPSDEFYQFALDLGGGVGGAYLSGQMSYAEQFLNATTRTPECGSYTCYRNVDPGVAFTGFVSLFARYNFSRRVGLGVGARFQPDAAAWTVEPPNGRGPAKDNAFANLLVSVRSYIALSPRGFVRSGVSGALVVGVGVGQIEATPGLLASARFPSAHVVSGLGNAHVGLRLEVAFAKHFHVAGEVITQLMFPTFLVVVDSSLSVGFHL